MQQLFAQVNNNPAQLKALIENMSPNALGLFAKQQQAMQQQQHQQPASAATPTVPPQPTPAEVAAKAKEIMHNNTQRISAARQQMRGALGGF